MKRHHQRTAQNLFTLSLLSGLTLLAACGGGGKGGGAPAAPAATPEVTLPSLIDITAKDEPFIVSPSSSTSEIASKNKYQLNILDGGTQTLVKTFTLNTPLDGRWIAVNLVQSDPTTPSKLVDKGPGTLYFINEQPVAGKVHPGGPIYQVDLTRKSDLSAKVISNITNACFIKSSYNIKQDGSQVALVVSTANTVTGECGDSAHNVDKVVVTDDSTSQAGRDPIAANKVLQYLYDNTGTLTGILVETKLSDGLTAQFDVLSKTMDSVISPPGGVIIDNTTKNTYTIDPTKPGEIGSAWIARKPGSYSEGYLRIQNTSAAPAFNRFYHFTWDPSTSPVTAKVELINSRAMTPGSLPNTGTTDDNKYIYFVNGQNLIYGPTDDPDLPFKTLKLGFTTYTTLPVSDMAVTPSSVILVQKDASNIHIIAVNKATGYAQEIAQGGPENKLKFLGIRGDDIYTTHVVDGDTKGVRLLRRSAVVPYTDFNSSLSTLQTGMIVQTKVYDPAVTYGRRDLGALVMCEQVSPLIDTCLGATLKVFDLNTKALASELGQLVIEDADSITVDSPQALTSTNNVFSVTKTLPDGVTVRTDPWLFNSNLAHTLKYVETFKTTTSSTTK
ncbi:MAG TPA: hypothetical protein VFM48_16375 [Aquabacterium sp.]|nr:hypothetical protein [Aquabacterium sp.]